MKIILSIRINNKIYMSFTLLCMTCKNNIKDGIMRDGNPYCSTRCYVNKPRLIPLYNPKPRSCNYCFVEFDTNIHMGVPYEPMWFCCPEHLELANPRPKIVLAPVPAPFIGPHIIRPTLVPGPFVGHHIIHPHMAFVGSHIRFFP